MRCPNCGTENIDQARFCQACARPLGPAYAVMPAPAQVAQPPSKDHTAIIVVVVIIVILAVIGAVVFAFLLVPKADLRADLQYSASNDWLGLSNSGTITVFGTIYNYGNADGGGTVYLTVWDGYESHSIHIPTGVVLAGLSVSFYWSAGFDPMDADLVTVNYYVTTG
jgi:hypothetical protein